MIPVLDNPDIRHRAVPISVQTYHWMQQQGLVPGRAELIRGVIVEKMSKSPLHTGLTGHLWEVLLRGAGHQCWVRKEDPLTLADSEPEPDVSIVSGRREDYADHHPSTAELVVEVSVTTESADRAMLPAYAAAGVREVWLVLAGKQQVERYSAPAGGHYAGFVVFHAGETLLSTVLGDFSLPLSELFKPAVSPPV